MVCSHSNNQQEFKRTENLFGIYDALYTDFEKSCEMKEGSVNEMSNEKGILCGQSGASRLFVIFKKWFVVK